MILSNLDKLIWVFIVFSIGLCAWLSIIYNTKICQLYKEQSGEGYSSCACKKNKSKI